MGTRSRSIEIYLKEGVEEDDLIFGVWSALRGRGRPQDVFRRILRHGIRAMLETGELPRAAIDVLDPELLSPLPLAHALARAQAGRRPKPQEHPAPVKPSRTRAQGPSTAPEPVASLQVPVAALQKRAEPAPEPKATQVPESTKTPVAHAGESPAVEVVKTKPKLGRLM